MFLYSYYFSFITIFMLQKLQWFEFATMPLVVEKSNIVHIMQTEVEYSSTTYLSGCTFNGIGSL